MTLTLNTKLDTLVLDSAEIDVAVALKEMGFDTTPGQTLTLKGDDLKKLAKEIHDNAANRIAVRVFDELGCTCDRCGEEIALKNIDEAIEHLGSGHHFISFDMSSRDLVPLEVVGTFKKPGLRDLSTEQHITFLEKLRDGKLLLGRRLGIIDSLTITFD